MTSGIVNAAALSVTEPKVAYLYRLQFQRQFLARPASALGISTNDRRPTTHDDDDDDETQCTDDVVVTISAGMRATQVMWVAGHTHSFAWVVRAASMRGYSSRQSE